jgi:biopolymer transport protein ExbD
MQAGDNKSYDDINVTPMVDLYLVLLLIFIIMTTAGVQGINVQLPKAGKPAPPKDKAPELQAIAIDNQGKLMLNGKPTTLAALESALKAIKAQTPDAPVVVRGNKETQYQLVLDVVDLCGRLGMQKVGLATLPTP